MKLTAVGLAIIAKDNHVLIGKRRSKDPYVKDLTWVFPGGRLKSLDFVAEVEREAEEETGLTVKAERLIHVRLFPNTKGSQILCLYFCCTPTGGEEKVGGDLTELKWVKPTETYRKYFTTHTAAEVKGFLQKLEKDGRL